MAILPAHEDRLRLSEIFRHSRWHLDLSESLNDARSLLNRPHLGVVLTDYHLPDGGWRDVLHELARWHTTAPPVIVVSRLADERLWAEVLNLCGYDVLATPFHADEVLWSISSAWRHWRNNCVLSAVGSRVGTTHSHSASATPESSGGGLDSFHTRQVGNSQK
jgi:DNA-binding response OmpR family regulator